MGVPAHDMVFIFFASLTGLFKSSVFNIFQNVILIFNKCGNVLSSFFRMQENWVLHIFILQCRWELIFIFVLKLKLTSSNLPENPQGAPCNTIQAHWSHRCHWIFSHQCFLYLIMWSQWYYISRNLIITWYCMKINFFTVPIHPTSL